MNRVHPHPRLHADRTDDHRRDHPGILASIALPAYSDYVRRSRRSSEATSVLSDLRVCMEQFYQDNRSYVSSGTTCGVAMPTQQFFTMAARAPPPPTR